MNNTPESSMEMDRQMRCNARDNILYMMVNKLVANKNSIREILGSILIF